MTAPRPAKAGAFRRLGDETVHAGGIWTTVVATFEAPDGSTFTRDIVRSPGAVAVVPVLDGDDAAPRVVLLSQYRPAFDADFVEIPAGMRDVADEPPEETAGRELAEEVGLAPGRLELLGEIAPAVGMTDQLTTIFLATGCTPVPRAPHGPEEAAAEVVTLGLDEAIEWVLNGRITDAKSVVGLLLAERRLR